MIQRSLRIAGMALLTALLPSFAQSADLYVSPSGSGTACTPGSPCAMSQANAAVKAGDVVRLAAGTYTTAIAPATNGAAGSRITYLGSLANPASTVVPTTTLTKRYVSMKGVRVAGSFGMDATSTTQYAQFDSIAWCIVDNDFGLNQAKDCVAYRVDVVSGRGHFSLNVPSTPVASFTIPERNIVRRCNMWLGEDQTYGFHVVQIRGAQNCIIDSNRVNIVLSSAIAGETDPFIAFYMKWCTFRDNRWTVRNNHSLPHLFRWRDSTMFNRVYRDTILMSGNTCRFAPSSSGSWEGSTDDNYFEGLYVKSSCIPADVALFYQNGTRRDTLRNCVVIDSMGKAMTMLGIETGASLIDHCTFVGNSRYGVVEFPCGVGTFGDLWPSSGSLRFTNNLIYGISAGTSGTNAAISWQFSSATNALTSNNNLYYMPTVGGGNSIRYGINTASPVFSAPGTGGTFYGTYGEDGNSLSTNPMFANASFTNFDPRLQDGSPAIGAGTDGLDIGATFGNGSDQIPPGQVNDLRVTVVADRNAMLAWTAPGDDMQSGSQVAQYEVRYSTSSFTAANFASQPLAPEPAITVGPGGTQGYALTALTPGQNYWVAMRSRDDAGNWSFVSNVVQFTASVNDLTPPAAVQDLSTAP